MKFKTIFGLFGIVCTILACNPSSDPKPHESPAPKVTLTPIPSLKHNLICGQQPGIQWDLIILIPRW